MKNRLEKQVAAFSGARAIRISDDAGAHVPEHAHYWPVLSLFVMGGYRNSSELGETCVSSPSAMFYRAGERHSNLVEEDGLEQIDIEFDPGWANVQFDSSGTAVRCWEGGDVALAARRLLSLWRDADVSENRLAAATGQFLQRALGAPAVRKPLWIDAVQARLDPVNPVRTSEIACKLDLSPAWMAESYRAAIGEGIGETVRRRRVERAVHLLRSTDDRQAEVAAAAGFCDQSNMIHACRAVLGRTPGDIRSEWRQAQQAVSPPS